MSYIQQTFLLVTVLCALVSFVQSMPDCARDDEACRESRMHPRLAPSNQRKYAPTKIVGEATSEYWLHQGKQFVKEKLQKSANKRIAKNVILFLGDGMGIATHSAARTLLGGEEKSLSFEQFPYTGLSRTYNVNKIVPDSASTATAYLCGVKANGGTIGVDGHTQRSDCQATLNTTSYVHSIAKWALDAGKSVGVVTNTRITHASPAGVYAHIAERDWENDSEVTKDCGSNSKIEDIAYQLIHGEVGSKLTVIMGGGKANFIDQKIYKNGKRVDGRNLIEEYKAQSNKNAYVETLAELHKVNLTNAERVFGLFDDNHMKYHLENVATPKQPTLEEMTRKALEILQRNDKGYFIFIEGGLIDQGHHKTFARMALDETVEFSKAIQAARELTSEEETLIVVTADHSHTLSYSGYSVRGNDIFARSGVTSNDKLPYMVLSYANGPSFKTFYDVAEHKRRDPTKFMTGAARDQFPATSPLSSETHGADDVAVFASGPWAHLFTGVYEQNLIPHLMAFSSCVGNGMTACQRK